jgi:hypothetical protein
MYSTCCQEYNFTPNVLPQDCSAFQTIFVLDPSRSSGLQALAECNPYLPQSPVVKKIPEARK